MENDEEIAVVEIKEEIGNLNSIEVMLNGKMLTNIDDYLFHPITKCPNISLCITFLMDLKKDDKLKFMYIQDGKIYKTKKIDIPTLIYTDEYIDLVSGRIGKLLPSKYRDAVIFV
jgi:hypothetical protein